MSLVHVAVAVIMQGQQVLIAKRPKDVHQGGLWEFPGGKVEPNERIEHALQRELREELDIDVDILSGVEPLIRIRHDYGDKVVLLDVWKVTRFSGTAKGAEGQPIRWVHKEALIDFDFPEANKPIISAILLPPKYLVTGEFESAEECIEKLQHAITVHGIQWVQFRHHPLYAENRHDYLELANRVNRLCREHKVSLVLNAPPSILQDIDVAGIHLSMPEARRYSERPVPADKWFGVSCHNAEELTWVSHLSPDYVLLSPVNATTSHPEVKPLGWPLFRSLVEQVACPVYALGGMNESDISEAVSNGAQGIAAISAWW